MELSLWQKCLERLHVLIPQQQFSQWISPLQVESSIDGIILYAPNQYVLDSISNELLPLIKQIISSLRGNSPFEVSLIIGVKECEVANPVQVNHDNVMNIHITKLNKNFTFENFIEGKSNQLAKVGSIQVSKNSGGIYNPLFIYGGVGLGKTHLMHAIGNLIVQKRATSKVIYLHSEQFVSDMVRALQNNTISKFKHFYRTVDALLIDDIQFFAGKERSQEEFFHTFDVLLEENRQIILTADRYHKEMNGITERLKSRFSSGLTVTVKPPDLETRVAILINKAHLDQVELDYEVAFFIAKQVCSNVRELEGALKRVIANAFFTGRTITLEFVEETLNDLLAIQKKLVSMDNIIKTVAEYYNLKISELLSKRRNRSIARPRQIAMALCKKITNHSLPEIGKAFGGRDHTTVLHACRQIKLLQDSKADMANDFFNLTRTLST